MSWPSGSRWLWRRFGTPSRCICPRLGAVSRACQSFAKVCQDDLSAFRKILGPDGAVTDASELEPFNHDWMRKYQGRAPVALLPRTTEQVSKLLRYCNERGLPVVPQGGNTGLVGGSVPVNSEVVLSTSRMNKIISFDDAAGVLVCEAGCILEALDTYLGERGFAVPLDLGAKGSCQIGGNISTNAGGVRFIRYGSLRGTVLGLEAVLADGKVLDLMTTARKDNTGYDLKQLFIGAEGTLGVVTRCSIAVPRRPSAVNVAFLACPSFESVTELFKMAQTSLGEVLSAVELMDGPSVALTVEACDSLRSPLGNGGDRAPHPFYVLVETSGSHSAHDSEKLEAFLGAAMEGGAVTDGAVAQDVAQAHAMWSLREHAPVAVALSGYTYKYDLSLPIGDFNQLVEETRRRLAGGAGGQGRSEARVVAYGHLGDGNLHLNVVCPGPDDGVLAALEPFLFEWVVERGGSISAEHGVGQHKRDYLALQRPGAVLEAMRGVKDLFDPRGIMNPWKLLPPHRGMEAPL